MSMMLGTMWDPVRPLNGTQSGRSCSVCRQTIHPADGFGMSEGVCAPCHSGKSARLSSRRGLGRLLRIG
jgi:hypothetical protein